MTHTTKRSKRRTRGKLRPILHELDKAVKARIHKSMIWSIEMGA